MHWCLSCVVGFLRGLMMLASVTGLPIILVAFLGGAIHKLVPNICSFTDFTNRRFGPVVQVRLQSWPAY